MFNSKNDWSRELIRCGATEWRVLSAESYNSKILPKYFVIPKTLDMDKFEKYTRSFYDGRICFWTYSFGKASLLRIGEMKSIEDSYIYNTTMEKIRLNDPEKQPLALFNLCDLLPSIQDVQRGYTRLRELCTPENPRQVLLQESKYLQLLEKSSWLLYVSLALKESNRAAQLMLKGKTVVLQENTGRDLCCVISSLTQIILDPYFRSIDGFQSLIQKEWVALEHPFSDRLGHLYNPDGQDKESPILLLFLDCVWQLLQQFPAEFEYSETYLTTIWDSAFIPIFDTFQFNSDFDRQVAVK
uniref:Myotubularin phosphatase domain-containing protein n=1 Tax=Megaselia scalaris TaxID=36166 RepID=T1GTG0_MEGSC